MVLLWYLISNPHVLLHIEACFLDDWTGFYYYKYSYWGSATNLNCLCLQLRIKSNRQILPAPLSSGSAPPFWPETCLSALGLSEAETDNFDKLRGRFDKD